MGSYDEYHPLHRTVGFGASAERDKLRLVKTEENWQDAVTVILCIAGVCLLIAGVAVARAIF